MNKTVLPRTQSVKVFRNDERANAVMQTITSADAARSGLPQNCIVIPMRILEHPEPIKRHRD
jgi:hypothetical protein